MADNTVTVLVAVELTVEEYAKAMRVSRHRGLTRDEYLAGGILREVRLTNLERRITHMHSAGQSDADIARHTGLTNLRISEVRRSLGLEANPRQSRRTA